jgi:DNA-binding MarR family transcriptional regulator
MRAVVAGASNEELVRQAWQAMMKISLDRDHKTAVSNAVGLSWTRILVLRNLLAEPQTFRGLAEHLSADPSYVTLIVDDLESRGLVRRTPHPTDRRSKLVELTDDVRITAAHANTILDSPPAALHDIATADLEAILRVHSNLGQRGHPRQP